MDFKDPQIVSMPTDLRREHAVDALLADGPQGDDDAELAVFAGRVSKIDVVAGAAARLRIARHLREHPRGQVTISPPHERATANRLLELLNPLPAGVVLSDGRSMPETAHYALVPATLVHDSEGARLAGEYALKACDRARLSDARTGLIGAAVMELADNALQHAVGTEDPPTVAATLAGRHRFVEIAALDLGRGLSEASDPVSLVRQIPDPREGGGFLANILRLGSRRGLRTSIEIISGTARLRWTLYQHRTGAGAYVPGTTVIVRINP